MLQGLGFLPTWCYYVCRTFGMTEGYAHRMKKPSHQRLYEIAERQGGYFTAEQAAQAGFSWERLSDGSKKGLFERASQGIYRLSRFPSSRLEDLCVAWLRTGPLSAISHESALAVFDLTDLLPGGIHVTVPRTASRRRKGLHLHTNSLDTSDVVWREGLRVTSVARTIADLAASGLAEEQLRDAIEASLARGLTRAEDLWSQAEKRGGRAARLIHTVLRK